MKINKILGLIIIAFLLSPKLASSQTENVGIGTNSPDNSAVLHLDYVTSPKGFLVPRMSTAQRNTIPSPAEGLIIYNNSTKQFEYYDGVSVWHKLVSGSNFSLVNGQIFVGDASNQATSVPMTGDANIASTGVLTITANAIDGTNIDIAGNVNNDLMYNNGTDWVRLGKGTDNQVLKIVGGNLTWSDETSLSSTLNDTQLFIGNVANQATGVSMNGDATLTNTGLLTIASDAVDGTNLSLAGNINNDLMYYNGTDWVRLAKGTDNQVLKVVGGNLAWSNETSLSSTLNDTQLFIGNVANQATGVSMNGDATLTNTGLLTIASNAVDGTNLNLTGNINNDLMYYNGTDWLRLAKGTENQVLKVVGGNLAWSNETSLSQTLNDGQILVGNAANQATGVALSGDAFITNAGALTVTHIQKQPISTDVPVDGQVLKWVTNEWVPTTNPAIPGGLISQTLRHNGTNWEASSLIFNNGTGVGIGSTNPQAKFQVNSDGKIVSLRNNIDAEKANITLDASSNSSLNMFNSAGTQLVSVNTAGNSYINVAANNFGIGNDSPQQKLDVSGAIRLGNTTTDLDGSLRWNGTNFQGYKSGAWLNLDAASASTLDDAYDAGGAGLGRLVTVDVNSIDFQGSVATPTLKVTNSSSGSVLHVENTGSGNSLVVNDEATDATPFIINGDGAVIIGNTSPEGKLKIAGGYVKIGSAGTVDVAAGDGDLFVQNTLEVDGQVYLRDVGISAGSGTAVVINGAGRLIKDVSSRRYKTDIKDFQDDFSKILKARPVHYKYKNGNDENIGFIAEEFDSLGLQNLVIYNKDGQPDALKYSLISVYLLEMIKQQQKEIEALKKILLDKSQGKSFIKSDQKMKTSDKKVKIK